MKQFYESGIFQPLVGKLSWSHYLQLLPLKDKDKINYYIDITLKNNLSKRQLCERIKNNEYERLDDKTKQKLIEHKETKVEDLIKNLIVIRNSFNYEIISEKMLQKLIFDDVPSFLKELGNSFSFISNEYKIKMEDNTKAHYSYHHPDIGLNADFRNILKENNVQIVTASDAHYPNDVGRCFELLDPR